MTYEERQQHKELRDRLDALRDRIAEGAPDEPLTREEGRELLGLLEAALERQSPERWDRAMDAIAEEAARRAGALALSRQS